MKKKLITILSITLAAGIFAGIKPNTTFEVSASGLPTEINLKDTTVSNVRKYYSSIASGNKGNQLLPILKSTLSKGQVGYTYSEVSSIYAITDRDWEMSPISGDTISNYTYSDDPYIYCLYRDDNHTSTASKMSDNKTSSKSPYQIDKEHVWAKSIGDFGTAVGAGTDLHHLIAADHYNNSSGHNNNCYGEPTDNIKIIGNLEHNKTGKLGTVNYYGQNITVYEPQDSDKGDIARALFYMAARYSSYTSASDPFLQLVDYPTLGEAVTSTPEIPAKHGIISTLLKWHELDPADDYEIHRNNLIYENYQFNRNPFIDYPDLARIVFDNSSTATFNPQTARVRYVGDDNVKPTNIAVNNLKLNYIEGEKLILDNDGYVEVTYENGTSNRINLDDKDLTILIDNKPFKPSTSLSYSLNSKSIEFKYSKDSATVTTGNIGNLSIIQNSPLSVKLTVQDDTYEAGSSFKLDRFDSIEITYQNGTKSQTTFEDENVSLYIDNEKVNKDRQFTISDNTKELKVSYGSQKNELFSNSITLTVLAYISPTAYYERISSEQTDWSGKYLLLANKNNTDYIFDGSKLTLDVPNNTVLGITESSKITDFSELDYSYFTINKEDSSYTIKSASGYYIGNDQADTNKLAQSENKLLNTISYDPLYAYVSIIANNTNTRLGFYQTSEQARFRYYKLSSTSYNQKLQLYKEFKYEPLLRHWGLNYLHIEEQADINNYQSFYSIAKKELIALQDKYDLSYDEIQNNPSLSAFKERYEKWAQKVNDNPYDGKIYEYKPVEMFVPIAAIIAGVAIILLSAIGVPISKSMKKKAKKVIKKQIKNKGRH